MTPEDYAVKKFESGFNCAESVLSAVTESVLGKNLSGIVPRIATGFGGGIARNGDVCGAVSGGVMALGLAMGRDLATESREPCNVSVDKFYNAFVSRFGSCKCCELTGVDLKLATKAERAQLHGSCSRIVAWAAKTVAEATGVTS